MPYLSDYAYHVLFCCCCCHSALYKYRVRLPWSLCPKWWFLSEESQSTQQSRSIQRSDHPSVDLQSLPLPALCDEKVRIDGWMWSHTCFTCTCIKTRSDHARAKKWIFHRQRLQNKASSLAPRHVGSRCQCQECHDMVAPHLSYANLNSEFLALENSNLINKFPCHMMDPFCLWGL